MANQKYICYAYIFAFLLAFFCFIAYSAVPALLKNIGIGVNLPQSATTIEAANVTNGITSFYSYNPFTSIIALIIIVILVIFISLKIVGSTRAAFA